MAFGKSFTGQQASIGPAGSGLFSRAMNQIPDVTYLSRDPVKATEIFCCIALYLHCVDHRVAAHSYIYLLTSKTDWSSRTNGSVAWASYRHAIRFSR
ncbi:hypothetical protein ACHAQD_012512 [Fusarium lateritium]